MNNSSNSITNQLNGLFEKRLLALVEKSNSRLPMTKAEHDELDSLVSALRSTF